MRMPRIIAFTGAGISAESNIPTFQEIPGIRDKLTRRYATDEPAGFAAVIAEMKEAIAQAEPNEAHLSLAKHQIPIITMNIDGLHQKAGSQEVIAVHGDIDNIVLYGDLAPKYAEAVELVYGLQKNDILLVIGASLATSFAYDLRMVAKLQGATVVEIQERAATLVPEFLKKYYEN